MALTSGTRIGSYEITAAIGAGGMGEVYRARDAKLGRDVALKVLPEAFARDSERMARFQREAKLLASLNHPNIAAIYGFEDSGATHALVMELVEGLTLADRIKSGALPIDEALRIAKQICEALEYAHERGIVHRDLKPANIKVTADDTVKILDFGLAKAVQGEADATDIGNSPTITQMATQSGVLLGTAAYMSPEQAKGRPVDRRADIWAFGCVLFEMFTRKAPFRGETVTDTLAAVLTKEPEWSQLPAKTPARVRVLLQRCLQKDQKQRLQAIGDARISLDEVLTGAPEPPSAAMPAVAPIWRRAAPWVSGAIVGVLITGLLAWKLAPPKPPPAEMMRFEIPVPPKVTLAASNTFALSPDGRQLAFVAVGTDGVQRIWVRSLDSLQARPVPGTESTDPAELLLWSPDGRRIAFSTSGKLETIDLASGTAQTLCTLASGTVGGSWNRDGVIIFSQGYIIMRVPAGGGAASPLTSPHTSGELHFFPSFLPDGRHFIYLRMTGKTGDSGIYVGSIDVQPGKQDSKRLLAAGSDAVYVPSSDPNMGQLLFLKSDGTLMAQPFDARRLKLAGNPVPVARQVGNVSTVYGLFSASANGVLAYRTDSGGSEQLIWYDRQGKILSAAGEPALYQDPALSPDGSKAVADRFDPQDQSFALWKYDFSRRTSTRFTFGSSNVGEPIWSPDGKHIILASNPSGIYDLYQKAANGATGEELLLKSSENKFPTDVSRDERFLLYYTEDPKAKSALWVLPLQGDRKPFPFLRTEFNEIDGHFSPDGHWVAYVSDESGSGAYEVYVRPFSPDSSAADVSGGGAKWQVSYGGGGEPRWSADGKDLFYMTSDAKVMEVGVTTSPTFQAGTPKLIFQAPHQRDYFTGDYTIDGKRFLFIAPVEQSSQAQPPFDVVLNWQAALKEQQ
ncbi:MAG: protein kinase domain-containing protein [Candidatus Acidiferrales bacterium]